MWREAVVIPQRVSRLARAAVLVRGDAKNVGTNDSKKVPGGLRRPALVEPHIT